MKSYTFKVKKLTLATVYIDAENETEARDLFYAGEYEEGYDIDILDVDVVSVRCDTPDNEE